MDQIYVPTEFKFAQNSSAGSFSGYGAVFGNVDDGGDLILPGAFASALANAKAQGRNFPMYMQHGAKLGADPRPVGTWTSIVEDDRGLKVDGQIVGLNTETGKYNYALVKEGAMNGLSIGYRVKSASYGSKAGEPRRTIKEMHLGEVSIVDQPMNALAKISSVKSIEEIISLREAEDYLRDAGGFSRTEAKSFLAQLMNLGQRDADGGMKEIAQAIERRKALLLAA